MFSGIIEEIGIIEQIRSEKKVALWDGSFSEGHIFEVEGNLTFSDAYVGCSIALNGVCLTVTEINDSKSKVFLLICKHTPLLIYKILLQVSFGISPETLRRSNLKGLKAGSKVNLERALKNDGRNSGHVVQVKI
jgi:riboflavin synthase